MYIRKKVFVLVSSVLIALIVFSVIISSKIILNGFKELERKDTQQNVQRAVNSLSNELRNLAITARDYAQWNNTYQFMVGQNPDYISTELSEDTLIGIRVNLLAIANTSAVIYNVTIDLDDITGEKVSVSDDFWKQLSNAGFLNISAIQSKSGIIVSSDQIWLVAANPITTSNANSPIVGILVMGRLLNDYEVARLSETTKLRLQITRFTTAPASMVAARRTELEGGDIVVQPLTGTTVSGYAIITDAFGEKSLLLNVKLTREIYKEGKLSLLYLVAFLCVSGLVFGLLVLFLLDRFVLFRLVNLDSQIRSIREDTGTIKRVSLSGKDELSNFSHTINQTLDSLAKSRKNALNIAARLRNANVNLKKLDSTKTDFLNMVSHELKTPLTPIRANLDLLMDGSLGKLKRDQLSRLKVILRNSERLRHVIGNMLEITRIEAGKIKLNIEKVQVNEVAKEVMEDIESAAGERNLKVAANFGNAPLIYADRERIKECISNYAQNALKFTERGSIKFTTQKVDNYVKVMVTDTGAGIEKQYISNLFQRFYQTGNVEVGKATGVGLGLYSVRKLVELHKGKAGVETELGKGSTFWFMLPVSGGKK